MPVRLDSKSADFAERFASLLATKREVSADIEAATRAIVDDVAHRGDIALIEATRKFDRLDLDAARLRVTAAEIDAAIKACDAKTLEALELARKRIESFHRQQLPADQRFTDALGVELGWRWSAIESVGLYVPGGTAAYPSSVLMNAVPAQVEHDVNAKWILITDSTALADEVERAVEAQLATLPREQIARASWHDFGAVILVKNLREAADLANAVAAEHLEIMTSDPESLAAQIRNAGAIFLGPHTPEAIGDYVGGSNHVLPTARSGRFSSRPGLVHFLEPAPVLTF